MGRDQGVGTGHSKPNAGGSPPLLSLQFLEVPPVLSWWGQGPHDCSTRSGLWVPPSLSCRPCPASWIRLNADAKIKAPSATYLPAVRPVRASVPAPVERENSASHRHY